MAAVGPPAREKASPTFARLRKDTIVRPNRALHPTGAAELTTRGIEASRATTASDTKPYATKSK